MRQAIGALAALAVMGVLLVGPLYVAVSSADSADESIYRCGADVGCDNNNVGGPMPSAG